ncbi:hypothetical protein [Actinocatenispora sera]|uniref:Uncharacterized protein n=1 Tax=Actinocatenispora sera TaxID=390989 RepID=A0A810L337_9ACTN|nr:hypothetical protein [Actinocatenispora sera]BCJ29594.1 hypothetical protein Asera_37020 [Actinocatenispora sera]BCJ29637.1 hypothetical protein Asera_37450 [Actinocatenispora sera]BCJ29677.1 hypothetical protein Asera_37850 [Actinocatenispora sera]
MIREIAQAGLLVALIAVVVAVVVGVAHAVKASFDAHERAEIRAFRRRLAARDRDASGSGGGR